MLLSDLAQVVAASRLEGEGHIPILGLQADHRKVARGDVFICIPGFVHDGHNYAQQAYEQGAVALVVERDVDIPLPKLFVSNTRQALGAMAASFYGHPSRQMKLIGVTGTNGKTTTTYIISHILSSSGNNCGIIGTIEAKYADKSVPMVRTTPEALDLQPILRDMVNANIHYCAMEVSSNALELGRAKGCRFRTAVFTNLTQDHLDYHQTMERYRDAKALLFARLGNDDAADETERQYAVLNADDPASAVMANWTAAQTITYGIEQPADIRASDISYTLRGTAFTLHTYAGTTRINTRLVGKFNLYNTLAAVATVMQERISLLAITEALATIQPVEGRMETVEAGQPFLVLVDYAHTPDGLENALRSVREFAAARVITVFGCGGDRDRTKRPIMGRIAAAYSDYVIVTSDNPRTEDPGRIIEEVAAGIHEVAYPSQQFELEVDREVAIERAVLLAEPDDVVLIAGKGHETYQILKDRTIDFDDRHVAAEAIKRRMR